MEVGKKMNKYKYWNDRAERLVADPYDIVKYCDIYKCENCPRYGDDCDGEDDERD